MKVWITKYALTKGIFTIEATEPNENGLITPINKLWDCYHGEGRERVNSRKGVYNILAVVR